MNTNGVFPPLKCESFYFTYCTFLCTSSFALLTFFFSEQLIKDGPSLEVSQKCHNKGMNKKNVYLKIKLTNNFWGIHLYKSNK